MPSEQRRSTRQLVDHLLEEQVIHINEKWHAFKEGDGEAALTDLEVNFLLSLRKLEQDADLQEAASSYLSHLPDADLERFWYTVEAKQKALPEPEAGAE